MAIYPLRATLARGFHFCLGFLLVVVLSVVCRAGPHGEFLPDVLAALPWLMIGLIPVFLLILAFGWSLAILFGLAQVRFRDTRHITEVGLQAMYFLTAIIYPAHLLEQKGLGIVLQVNPLMPFLQLLRLPMCDGVMAPPVTFAAAGLITLATAGLAALAVRFQERKIVFHL
jgi:ABC-type polysaccharide/polyol phosphate export permease